MTRFWLAGESSMWPCVWTLLVRSPGLSRVLASVQIEIWTGARVLPSQEQCCRAVLHLSRPGKKGSVSTRLVLTLHICQMTYQLVGNYSAQYFFLNHVVAWIGSNLVTPPPPNHHHHKPKGFRKLIDSDRMPTLSPQNWNSCHWKLYCNVSTLYHSSWLFTLRACMLVSALRWLPIYTLINLK